LLIDAATGEIVSHTAIEQMKTRALELWNRDHAKIKAAVLQTRDG
jgi:hypothetical protein